jgi:hypothetical protein
VDPKGGQKEASVKDSPTSGTAASEEAKWDETEERSKDETFQRAAEEQVGRQEQVTDAELDKIDEWIDGRHIDESQESGEVMDGHRMEEQDSQFTIEAELAHREAAEAYGQNTDTATVSGDAAGPGHIVPTLCNTDGCRRVPWNGELGQSCCRSCTQSTGALHGHSCDTWALRGEGWDNDGGREREAVYRTEAEIADIVRQADPKYDAIVQSNRAHMAKFADNDPQGEHRPRDDRTPIGEPTGELNAVAEQTQIEAA